MTRIWKDAAALGLTLVAVLTFIATHDGWNVWLVGDNHRWAAAVMLVAGLAACTLGAPDPSRAGGNKLLAGMGWVALALGIAGIISGSLTVLSLLAVDTACLWALSALRHVQALPRQPLAH